jgi:arabinogalactan endo-1,4-beta-galactosidase
MRIWAIFAGVLVLGTQLATAQDAIVGADVSYPAPDGEQGSGLQGRGRRRAWPADILKNHGYTWVRLRVMVDPISLPNNLDYTIALAKDAKARGFKLLLDFHYSDDWADPGHQTVPRAWAKMSHAELQQAVFAYTRDTIAAMRKQHVLPDMVQVGNEVTVGMMWPDGRLPASGRTLRTCCWPGFTASIRGAAGAGGRRS